MLSVLLIVVLAALSLRVWGRVRYRWNRGLPAMEPVPRNRSPWLPVACGAAAVLVAIMLAFSLMAQLSSPQATPEITLSVVQVTVFDGLLHIIVALALLTAGGRIPLADCGIHTRHIDRQLRDGLLGFLAALAPVMLVLIVTAALRTPENQHPFLKLLDSERGDPVVVFWLLMMAVVVAPIKEELIFRVMLQDGLARRIGATPAIGLTSVLFCLVHGFPDSLALLPLAVVLGYVYDRRQSVLSVVLIHALFNLTNTVILLMNPEAPV